MIRAIVFDIGGIFEIVPEGGDPTKRYPAMITRWEEHLQVPAGSLRAQLRDVGERLMQQGKDLGIGTCTEEEWWEAVHQATGMQQDLLDRFIREYWDVYLGYPNEELMTFFAGLRPDYQTALLSNSASGARRAEEERYHLSTLTDLIIYSHEVGVEKPHHRIFEITCERLGRQPDEIVFLDDAPPNVAAAQAFGIHAILFTNNAQAIQAVESCLREYSA